MFLQLAHTKLNIFNVTQDLEISRGFLIEVDAAIRIAYQLSYCEMKDISKLGELIISCFKQLSAMINHHSN